MVSLFAIDIVIIAEKYHFSFGEVNSSNEPILCFLYLDSMITLVHKTSYHSPVYAAV